MSVQAISASSSVSGAATSGATKTTTIYNLDGSNTVIVTDASGNVVSKTTTPASASPASAQAASSTAAGHSVDVSA